MAVKIGHASLDENGKAKGGKAGDQTGKEVTTRDWYAKGWNKLIRAKDAAVAEKIAKAMELACANNHIGYDQSQRTTLYTYALAAGWDLSKIKIDCETDCSALVSVCVNAAGVRVSKDMYTGNEAATLHSTGYFDVLTDSKYLSSSDYLKRGDILLKEGSHTAIVLSNGVKAGVASTAKNTNPYRVPSRALKLGMKGDDVKWLQFELNQSGASLDVDGSFGKLTLAAVKAFQKAYSLEVDGVAGPKTRAKLLTV